MPWLQVKRRRKDRDAGTGSVGGAEVLISPLDLKTRLIIVIKKLFSMAADGETKKETTRIVRRRGNLIC